MPILKGQQLVDVTLPSSDPKDPAIVTVNTRATVGDFMAIDTRSMTEMQIGVKLLAKLIVKWNYTDEAGEPVPVSEEAVGRLDPQDVQKLTESLNLSAVSGAGLSETEKKTSSSL